MLWPMMWTGSSGKAVRIRSPSLLARNSTPAIGWTRVTSTRFPGGPEVIRDPAEIGGQGQRTQADPREAEEPVRQNDRRL